MKQYLDILKEIRDTGTDHTDRTGTGRRSINTKLMQFDLRSGFPILTTKKINFKNVVNELLWFISGSIDSKVLENQNTKIWKDWSLSDTDYNNYTNNQPVSESQWKNPYVFPGSIGPMYGRVWRGTEYSPDQLKYCLDLLQTDPTSSRIVMTSLLPDLLPIPGNSITENILAGRGALAPCHGIHIQFTTQLNTDTPDISKYYLNLTFTNRSQDFPIGTPYNISSYALLLKLVARHTNMIPHTLTWIGVDNHIYLNQLDLTYTQLNRKPYPLPYLYLNKDKKDIFTFTNSDIELVNYQYHPHIPYPVSV